MEKKSDDKKNSYQQMIKIIGGTKINITPTSPSQINPFEILEK